MTTECEIARGDFAPWHRLKVVLPTFLPQQMKFTVVSNLGRPKQAPSETYFFRKERR